MSTAVAIGGGTGLPRVLSALLETGSEVTAVVTMADDGGSSGALRREIGMLPPGDARNCLVALAEDPEDALARVLQYRFERGEGLAGHAVGNLVIAALVDVEGDFARALEVASGWLRCRGTVLPSTLRDVRLMAVDRDGGPISGQAVIARSPVPIESVVLEPRRPPAYPAALDAVREADVVVVGPGSLYTSLIPNFLVDGMAEALRSSRARRVYLCNVANQRGETEGLDADGHVAALERHGLQDAFDVVVVHEGARSRHTVDAGPEVRRRIEERGYEVIAEDLTAHGDPLHHDADSLARILGRVA